MYSFSPLRQYKSELCVSSPQKCVARYKLDPESIPRKHCNIRWLFYSHSFFKYYKNENSIWLSTALAISANLLEKVKSSIEIELSESSVQFLHWPRCG